MAFLVALIRLVVLSFVRGITFRKVPIGTLRNETVSGRKCLALRRRQGFVDCFVRIEVLCGFTISRSFVSVSFINNIAFRKVPIGTLRNETVSGRKNESSATWSVKCGFDSTFLLLSFVRCFVSQSTISFRFVSQSTVSLRRVLLTLNGDP